MRWWRVFRDRLSGGRDPEVEGRRRRAERYGFEAKLKARCSSWPRFVELFSGDVSEGGLYIPTDQKAEIGESVTIDLTLPDGVTFAVSGKVVNVIDAEQAARHGKPPGLGIMLDPLEGSSRETFQKLVAKARADVPRPDSELGVGSPPPPSPAPPVSRAEASQLRASAVLEAIDAVASRPPAVPPPIPPPIPTGPPPIPPPSKPLARARKSLPIVGIDLGTTNTSVAAVIDKKVTILAHPDGSRSTPSVISFDRDGKTIHVGAEARRRIATDPGRTIVSPKRLLGRKYEDREVQTFVGQAAYRTFAGPDGSVVIDIGGAHYAMPQIISYLLQDARRLARSRLGTEITQAVVSVPISFEDHRVEALRRAGKMAGIEIVAVIDEPSSAALANRFDPGFGGVVGVYDFGGGTFDFSVVDVSGGDFKVLGTAGDTWLGGDDFDRVLAEAAANQFWRQHKVDLRKQALEWQRLLFACEQAKRDLSSGESAVISVPDVLRTAEGMIGLHLSLDRPILERACAAIVQRSLDTCGEALELLDMKPADLSAVYLSGGTTYVPAVRDALARTFQVPVRTGVPPEYAVCLGAAIHAAQIQFQARQTLDAR